MTEGIAIVTGGSAGIGRAVAIALGKAGWSVVLSGRNQAALDETKKQIETCHVVCGDLTEAGAPKILFEETVKRFGRVDLLFNNAGISIGAPSLEDLSVEDFARTLTINLTVPFACMKEAFLQMKSQSPQGGRIINNGSISAHVPRPGSAAYTASKHGISGLTKTGSLDGRKYNIAVCQIDIGNAATDMGSKNSSGSMQANGTTASEPLCDVKHVASSVVYMASLPLEVNVLSHTLLATAMPCMVGRG